MKRLADPATVRHVMKTTWSSTKQVLPIIAVTALLATLVVQLVGAMAQVTTTPDLVTTTTPQLRKTLDYPANQPLNSSNTDCTNLTYRLAGDQTMQSGCFTMTTHGLLQNGGPVILNGTDEAVPLDGKGYTLVPTPNQSLILALSGADTFGANVRFYNYTDLQDEYLMAGTRLVHYLAPTAPPSATLLDSHNRPVVINASAMAFSTNGDWMVAESPRHALIRVNLATFQITAFAAPFNTQPWDYSLPLHPLAISDDGRYVAIQGGAPVGLKIYDLASCTGDNSDNLAPLACNAHDYWPLVSAAIPTIYGTYGLVHLRFVNDTTISFDVKVNDIAATSNTLEQWQSAAYTLSADTSGAAIDYLALGDSYTSGEGTFDYVTGTDTPVNMCHLSLHAYPFLIGQQVFSRGHSVACSGASIRDLDNLSDGYYGQAADHTPRRSRSNASTLLANFSPGYLAQLEFIKTYQPNVISVSVAGNDIGYSYVLQQCAEPHLFANTCYPSYEDKAEVYAAIDRKYRDMSALYSRLKAAAPHSTIYAIGYPQVAATGGDCALNVRLNYDEISFTQSVVNYLNKMIGTAAASQGVDYIDISQALAGHRLCETTSFNVAMNGLTSGTDSGVLGLKFLGKESFHPNAFGHELIANAIMTATHNFAQAPLLQPTNQVAPDSTRDASLNTSPKSGRPQNQLVWDGNLSPGITGAGQIEISLSAATDGLRPNTSYDITLDRSGSPLGHSTTDSVGDLTASLSTPVGTSPGNHTIEVVGVGASGEPIDVSGPIYLPATDDDYDGDGVANGSDSCPTVSDSGVDADLDGADDACDPLITQVTTDQPPANPNQGEQSNDTNQTDPASASPQSTDKVALQADLVAAVTVAPFAAQRLDTGAPPNKVSVNTRPVQAKLSLAQYQPPALASLKRSAANWPPQAPLTTISGQMAVLCLCLMLLGPLCYTIIKNRFLNSS